MIESSNTPSISIEDFSELMDTSQLNILDVREPEEIALSSLPNSINIPMMELENNIDKLSSKCLSGELPTIVVCRSGARSEMVTMFLLELGFKNVHNLSDGINGLSKLRRDIKSY